MTKIEMRHERTSPHSPNCHVAGGGRRAESGSVEAARGWPWWVDSFTTIEVGIGEGRACRTGVGIQSTGPRASVLAGLRLGLDAMRKAVRQQPRWATTTGAAAATATIATTAAWLRLVEGGVGGGRCGRREGRQGQPSGQTDVPGQEIFVR